MFQNAEEVFKGANGMIEHGILDNPRPDAAMAYHMMIGKNQVGTYMYNAGGIMMNSVDEFKIIIQFLLVTYIQPFLKLTVDHT